MSDGTEVVEQEEDKTSKRKTLSLSERIKVVDFLRAQVEPITADSNAEIAAIVSSKTGVEINWQQLKYMIDDLEEWNLGSKVYVKSPLSVDDQLQAAYERSITLEARIVKMESEIAALKERFII